MAYYEIFKKIPKTRFAHCCFSAKLGVRQILVDTISIILGIWDLILAFKFYPWYPSQTSVFSGASRVPEVKQNLCLVQTTLFTRLFCTYGSLQDPLLSKISHRFVTDCCEIVMYYCYAFLLGFCGFRGFSRYQRFLVWNFSGVIFKIGCKPHILEQEFLLQSWK